MRGGSLAVQQRARACVLANTEGHAALYGLKRVITSNSFNRLFKACVMVIMSRVCA